MNIEYQVIYDVRVQAYQLGPLLVVLGFPIFILFCLAIARWRRRFVPTRTKVFMWGAYLFYAALVGHSYWDLVARQSAASDLAKFETVEGRLRDGWAKTKSDSKTMTLYQHFTVQGVEFLQENRRRRFTDFMIPRRHIPVFPLIEGARVRITYRGEGANREILRFEIAERDLAAK